MKKQVSWRLSQDLLDYLRAEAEAQGVSQASLLETMIAMYRGWKEYPKNDLTGSDTTK